ncbi:MAG: dihydrodipicolinate synthase family protein, partial [Calditrichota bacterium]
MSFKWSGVFPAVTTKFNPDFSVNADLTARHIISQVEAGVHGIVVAGSLGEASTLSQQDKLQLVLTASKAVDGRVPIISGLAEG